ncbi:MAG: nitroreductase family protein, partial [Dehalococcoidia bacterium]
MPDISLFDAIHAQRAIRRFKPDPVPQEAIEQVLNAAIRAPSGSNSQPWSFVVVRDQALKEAIAEWYLDVWENVYTADPRRAASTVASSAEYLAYHLAETPVLIFPCYRG